MNFVWPQMHWQFKLLLFVCLLFPLGVFAAQGQPASYVVDNAGVIEEGSRAKLAGLLQELEQKTTVQMIILTVPSTEGIPIEQYSLEQAEKWGLGKKGKDNGLLMVIAVKDRKYRFETGYGLEQILPDSMLGSIGRSYLVPAFKAGDYTKGVMNTTSVIARTIADAQGIKLSGLPEVRQSGRRAHGSPHRRLTLFYHIRNRSLFPFPLPFRGHPAGTSPGRSPGGRRTWGFGRFRQLWRGRIRLLRRWWRWWIRRRGLVRRMVKLH